ncbi:MAG: Gldg family protein [Oscillospiraceae bacterium]|nr:Gldg family protein [Oscillospiraceae bacterium]
MINLKSKRLRYGSAALAITVIVVALVVLLNVIVSMLGDRYNLKIDLTPDGIFDISEQSKSYLQSLEQDVEMVVMIDEAKLSTAENIYFKHGYEVLKKYALYSDRVNLKFVDMTQDPTYAERYSAIYRGSISPEDIIINSYGRMRVVSLYDLYNSEFSYQTYRNEIVSSKAEQVLTSAVMYVTDPNPQTAVILDVESASATTENIAALLSANGFDTEAINPLEEPLPENADLIVLNAPLNDFPEYIIRNIYDFMENGGDYGKNMVYLASFDQNRTDNIDVFLAEWGIEAEKSIIAEENPNFLATAASPYALRNYIEPSEYSEDVTLLSTPVISFEARPVNILFETSGNVRVQSLLSTSETSIAISDEMMELLRQGIEPEFNYGPYNTMALSSKYMFNENNEQILSNLLVFGSTHMLDPGITNAAFYNNGEYFISVINKMTGKSGGISIVSKDLSPDVFEMDYSKFRINRAIFQFILPLLVLACGFVVWLLRRHR